MPCRALPGHTSFINSVPCCAVSWTYLSRLRRAMSYVRLAISVPCHAVSYFLSSSPCHAVPCLCFCRSVLCHALPAGGRGSSVSSRVMRLSVSFRAGSFSCEGRSVSCRVIHGGCKFEPCHAMSYHLCAWPLPCLALISCRFLGPCRVV